MESITEKMRMAYEDVNKYLIDHPGTTKSHAFKVLRVSAPTYRIAKIRIEGKMPSKALVGRPKKKTQMITIEADRSIAIAKETVDSIAALIGKPHLVIEAIREYLK